MVMFTKPVARGWQAGGVDDGVPSFELLRAKQRGAAARVRQPASAALPARYLPLGAKKIPRGY
jgi:hypothetical protein